MNKRKNSNIIHLIFFLSFFLSLNADTLDDKLKQANILYTQYLLKGCNECIDNAIEIYNSIITDKSNNDNEIERAKINLARAYYIKKEYEKSIKLFEELLINNNLTIEEQEKILYQLGYIKYLLGKYEESKEIFKKLKNDFVYSGENSKVPYSIYMWGRCYEMEGNTEAARAKYLEVINNYPEHGAAQYAEQGLRK